MATEEGRVRVRGGPGKWDLIRAVMDNGAPYARFTLRLHDNDGSPLDKDSWHDYRLETRSLAGGVLRGSGVFWLSGLLIFPWNTQKIRGSLQRTLGVGTLKGYHLDNMGGIHKAVESTENVEMGFPFTGIYDVSGRGEFFIQGDDSHFRATLPRALAALVAHSKADINPLGI